MIRLRVVGYPAKHSKSPFIHGAFAAAAGMECEYTALDIVPSELADFIAGAKEQNITGFNVTMPHKETIIPLLDGLDGFARSCGAVNTIVNRGGRLIGYNTDGAGTVAALADAVPDPRGKTAVVIGTGGAARSACLALSDAGARVYALSRRDELPHVLGAETRRFSELTELARSADVIINATPLGMAGNADFDGFAFLDGTRAVVFDFVYASESGAMTRLLAEASRRGLPAVDGLCLLVHQAVRAWEIFTGEFPLPETVREVMDRLNGTE